MNDPLTRTMRRDAPVRGIVATANVSEPSDRSSAGAPVAVWVAHASESSTLALVQMNAGNGRAMKRLAIDAIAADGDKFLAAGFGAVWVASEQDVLHRIDPATGRAHAIRVGSHLGRPAICAGSVWVPSGRDGGAIVRVDPETGAVAGVVPLVFPRAVVACEGALWASHGPRVTRIDPRTRRTIETFDLGSHVLALAVDGAAVWAATLDEVAAGAPRTARESGGLYRLVPGVSTPTPICRIEGRASGLCIGAGSVWVAAASLYRFDLVRAELVVAIDEAVTSPLAVGDRVWARRYDYASDTTALVAFDAVANVLEVLDAQGDALDLALG